MPDPNLQTAADALTAAGYVVLTTAQQHERDLAVANATSKAVHPHYVELQHKMNETWRDFAIGIIKVLEAKAAKDKAAKPAELSDVIEAINRQAPAQQHAVEAIRAVDYAKPVDLDSLVAAIDRQVIALSAPRLREVVRDEHGVIVAVRET